ncbi:hypothetical protein [Paenibacillus sp. sgz302251]|uniref:hypothetical protein n=1 Tax=Paenibacillus sp. sgz302251 TaxID=3414493 RepID=UPI003C7C61CA
MVNINRAALILIFLSIILVGCVRSTESFQGQIEDVKADSFVVNCSEGVNKGKKGAINDIGYGCPVQFTDQTTFRDESGKSLTMNDFSSGLTVKVVLTKPVNIRGSIEKEKSVVLTAKEMVLLTREVVTSKEDIIHALVKQGLTVTNGERNLKSDLQVTLRGIEPQVYIVNGEELILYHFPSEHEQQEGWAEFPATAEGVAYKNYNIDSFLLLFKYGEEVDTEIPTKIQHAVNELAKY